MIGRDEIRTANILLVDDSAVNILLMQRMLARDGYTHVSTTTDPTTVCALYAMHRYDLIILDLMMPVMSGFAVLEGLKLIETEGYVPVIVLTAQPAEKLRALEAGARDFVSKPFDHHEMLTRIANALEVRLLLRESHSYGKLLEQFDQHTGLPNRRRFCSVIDDALTRTEHAHETLAVMFVAVDRFKAVSDVLGRSVGGAVIAAVADRLIACLGPMTTIARLDGAEFGVLLVLPRGDTDAALETAQRLRATLRQPLRVDEHELSVTASIGIALAPDDAQDTDALLAFASIALSDARTAGGDGERFYSAEINARAAISLDMEHALRGALERDEFHLEYQPKMRIASGEWSSAEALLRWVRPGHNRSHPPSSSRCSRRPASSSRWGCG
jgi:diguanylate cyclase (GGDEF)-like protein